jgi:DNA-binding response OmpR family regulator
MGKNILIADDSQTFLISLSFFLKKSGFGVIPAENGMEVLKLVNLWEPGLIILDVNMAVMDGITVLRLLKENRKTAHVPVIMLSTDSSVKTMENCRALGCYSYLHKPVKLHELHAVVEECFFAATGTNRRHVRTMFHKKVTVIYKDTSYDLPAETLSAGGIYVRKKGPLPVGSEVRVIVPLRAGAKLSLKGVVIYTKDLFGGLLTMAPGMAIEFTELSGQGYQTLQSYIEDLLLEDVPDGPDA